MEDNRRGRAEILGQTGRRKDGYILDHLAFIFLEGGGEGGGAFAHPSPPHFLSVHIPSATPYSPSLRPSPSPSPAPPVPPPSTPPPWHTPPSHTPHPTHPHPRAHPSCFLLQASFVGGLPSLWYAIKTTLLCPWWWWGGGFPRTITISASLSSLTHPHPSQDRTHIYSRTHISLSVPPPSLHHCSSPLPSHFPNDHRWWSKDRTFFFLLRNSVPRTKSPSLHPPPRKGN